MKNSFRCMAAIALAAAVAVGCSKKQEAQAPQESKTLNIFIWSAYLPDSVIQKFTEKTGIKVNYDTYDANEALVAKLQSGVADYDIVVPSDYMVARLKKQDLLLQLDHTKLPNMKNLDPRFLDKAFDPRNTHSLPYFWGTTGLGYNKQSITTPVDSWGIVFDEAHKGRVLMLDDMRECFAVALKFLGKSLNERDPEVLRQAAELLKKQKDIVKTYNSGDFANILASGDVDLAHGYNGQIAEVVAAEPEKLAYIVPKEGGTFWMDNLCIPSKARNVENAYKFINFIMEPEINAEIVNDVHYASANSPAKQFITPEIVNDISIYPPDEILKNCEFIEDIGEALTVMDQYWTEVKAQ